MRTPRSTDPTCPGGDGRLLAPWHHAACTECWARLPRELRERVRIAWRSRMRDSRALAEAITDVGVWLREHPSENVEGLAYVAGSVIEGTIASALHEGMGARIDEAIANLGTETETGDPGAATPYVWRYAQGGKVAHALRHATDSGALCGVSMLPASDWRGTGSQTEYETVAALPACKRCARVAAQ